MANFEDTNDDSLFEDAQSTTTKEYEEPKGKDEGTEEQDAKEPKAKLESTEDDDEGVSKGEVDEEEPPVSDKEAKKEGDEKPAKMIPEHQFKAALKQVTSERDEARALLADKNKAPPPDRTKQPAEYDLDLRVEASKQAMMRSVDDYDTMIEHFREMEKANPLLTQIVSGDAAPARMAYDLAKRDLEFKEMGTSRTNGDWDAFKAWQASGKPAKQEAASTERKTPAKVPNLNRTATGIDPNRKGKASDNDDDDLWAGAVNDPNRF